MLRKLPRWVEYGAFTLALLAGTVNAVGLLGFQHQSVSHLSGTTTMFGAELFTFSSSLSHLAGILFSFLLGSALSGYLISSESLKLGRNYDLLLMIEGLLLLGAIFFLDKHAPLGHYLASAACGLQNALATRYSGAVVRTTHVTGIFTDLGIMLGGALRGEEFDKRKCILFCLILLGFILGGTGGAYLYQSYQFMALIFPAGICFMLAASYRLYSTRQKKS
ncbi:YoaK family protein [Psychromonas aquimarina]|uniref:YoaK family protein n=1 Tax=Psychromonas aquimarina TaxID=444919 RepID=UPI0004072B10|nr:YoaK family protein [Psychromonas aquimarina]